MEDNKPAVSVIIPIYNVGKYLYRCLSSVAYQEFEDYEVIMINDGSTDDSVEIAKGFVERFTNFRLVDNTSKGVSSARNLGVSLARGEYVAFVDSDDYIDPNYLYKLYNTAYENSADVVHCNYILYYIDSGFSHSVWLRKPKPGIMSNIKMVRKTISDFYMRSYLWNKLWKRKLFIDNHITFPDMKFEDIATVSRLLYYANKGVAIENYLYQYTIRNGSIVQTVSLKNISDYILSLGYLRSFFAEKHEFKRLKYPFSRLAFAMMGASFANIIKYHYAQRNFKYCFKNIINAQASILYFFRTPFMKDISYRKELQYPLKEVECKKKPKKDKNSTEALKN